MFSLFTGQLHCDRLCSVYINIRPATQAFCQKIIMTVMCSGSYYVVLDQMANTTATSLLTLMTLHYAMAIFGLKWLHSFGVPRT